LSGLLQFPDLDVPELHPTGVVLGAVSLEAQDAALEELGVGLGVGVVDDALAVESMLFTVESSRARLQVLQIGFAHVLSQDVLPRAELLIKRAGEILKLRNRYAHAIYGKDNDSKELAIVTRGRKIHTVNIPLHELKHHLEQMRALSHDIGVMMLDTMPPPLPIPHELVSAPRHLTERSPGHTAPAPPEPPPPSPESPEAQSSEPPAL